MKKIIMVLLLLTMVLVPTFAGLRLGYAIGYPTTGVAVRIDLGQFSIDFLTGADYHSSTSSISFGSEVYGAYNFKLSDLFDLRLGAGVTSRLGVDSYWAPTAMLGFQWNIPNSVFSPYVQGNLGYGVTQQQLYWQARAGFFMKLI